ncbi:MAG: TIGR03000 domain-containing protein [Gemmataceae bacterium]
MNRQRGIVMALAAGAALLIGAESASAQRFGVGVGVYRPGGIGIGVGYGYGYGLGYPGYYGYYPGYRPYYGYGYSGYYPSYRYYNYYTPRVIVPTYVPSYNYSYSSPSYSVPLYSSQPARQPSYSVPDNAALITVNVPAGAEIWFSGDKTSQTGTTRRFETPALEPGSNYSYSVRARWTENGKERDETKKVAVHANDRLTVDFP